MHGCNCVVLGGAGAVGTMIAQLVAGADARVCVVDPREPMARVGPEGQHLAGDAARPEAAVRGALAEADVVVLALPETVALAALPRVAPLLRPDALLVETLSVKTGIAKLVEAGISGQALGLNPMFAPSLGVAGRPVAVVPYRPGPRGAWLLDLLAAAGARLVEVSAADHDRLAAGTQALTHAAVLAFGLALAELQPDAETLLALAPPPCAMLLAALRRVTSGTPEVYWDIQAANPYAATARAALIRGAARISTPVDAGSPDGFAAALREASNALEDKGGRLADLFDALGRHLADQPLTPHKETP